MTEADISRKIQKIVKYALPGCVLFKHNDRSNGGIPDISLTYGGYTTWLEVKYIRPDWTASQIRKACPPAQLHVARQLEARGRCLYLIAHKLNAQMSLAIIRPSELDRFLERPNAGIRIDNLQNHAEFIARLDDAVMCWAARIQETTT